MPQSQLNYVRKWSHRRLTIQSIALFLCETEQSFEQPTIGSVISDYSLSHMLWDGWVHVLLCMFPVVIPKYTTARPASVYCGMIPEVPFTNMD